MHGLLPHIHSCFVVRAVHGNVQMFETPMPTHMLHKVKFYHSSGHLPDQINLHSSIYTSKA